MKSSLLFVTYYLFHQYLTQFAHTFTGTLLYLLHARTGTNGVGVDKVDRHARAYIVQKSCSGIDIQTGAYHDEDIGGLSLFGSDGNQRDSLSEEHDEGAQQRTVAGLGARSYLTIVGCQRLLEMWVVHITTGTDLHQFAVKMNHL